MLPCFEFHDNWECKRPNRRITGTSLTQNRNIADIDQLISETVTNASNHSEKHESLTANFRVGNGSLAKHFNPFRQFPPLSHESHNSTPTFKCRTAENSLDNHACKYFRRGEFPIIAGLACFERAVYPEVPMPIWTY